MRQYYIYIMASRSRTLYVGVTNDLERRVYEHRAGHCTFTSKYRIHRLVYFEVTENSMAAIAREKQIKAWRREKRITLISDSNPAWDDLAADWSFNGVAEEAAGADSSLRSE